MFCPECGVEGHGKFCVECGTRISSAVNSQSASDNRSAAKHHPEPTGDWTQEFCYEQLIRYSFVRDQLILAGQRRPNRVTGEQLLKFYDTVASPEVSLEKMTVAMLPILERMGIKSGSQIEQQIQAPPGRVLLAVLCGLASGGYDIENVDQMSDGCIMTAFLPSTLITNRGQLLITVTQVAPRPEITATTTSSDEEKQEDHETEEAVPPTLSIHAAAKISGQLLDWGKSKRILTALLNDIQSHAELRGHVYVPPVQTLPPSVQPVLQNPPGMPEPKTLGQLSQRPGLVPPPIRRNVA